MQYQDSWLINLTIMGLIISGGIGYPVIIDFQRNWYGPWRERWDRLLLHTKLMLVGTATLLFLGAASIFILEWNNFSPEMSIPDRLLVSMFQSTTCRTAGFNTLEIGRLTNATLFIFILLMMIGAGPCSTAGGFKVSTLLVLVLRGWRTFTGTSRVNIGRRTLPQEVTNRAITTALLFAVVSILALTGLLTVEQSELPHSESNDSFLDAAFEVTSALGTVGLSTGVTPTLSVFGKLIIMVLMFMGRLGPITVFVAVSRETRDQSFEYASEEPLIG
jgi:trk system potassium uptake protein TrkH